VFDECQGGIKIVEVLEISRDESSSSLEETIMMMIDDVVGGE